MNTTQPQLLQSNKALNSYAMIERVMEWGGMRHMRIYGPGSRLKFPIGYAIGAIHYQKDYRGPMGISMFELSSLPAAVALPGQADC